MMYGLHDKLKGIVLFAAVGESRVCPYSLSSIAPSVSVLAIVIHFSDVEGNRYDDLS